jgi:RNA polymerase sigma-70 factor (ECF subfamily)
MVTATAQECLGNRSLFTGEQSPSDEELFLEYRATGRQEHFAALVHRHEQGLCRYLGRYLGNQELAEDVCQRTFLQVHLKQETFKEGRRLRPWIYRIATNQAIDALRRTRRHRAASLNYTTDDSERNGSMMDSVAAPGHPPIVDMVRRENSDWSHRAVANLPQRLQRVVELVFFHGLSYRETADALTLPLGTIKSRMSAALRQLRQAWEDSGQRSEPMAAAG